MDYDAATGKKAIFKIEGVGKDWAIHVDTEHKNYDFLSMLPHPVSVS